MVRWLTLRENPRDGLISIVVGALCAMFLSPLVLPGIAWAVGTIQVPVENASGLSGFLMGIVGITVSGFIIDVLKLRLGLIRSKADKE